MHSACFIVRASLILTRSVLLLFEWSDDSAPLVASSPQTSPGREPVFNWDDPQPPLASLISLEPQADGWRTHVTAQPGAVPGGSYILVSGLDTGHSLVAVLAGNGSFSATVIAPPDSYVQIKADKARRLLSLTIVADPTAQGQNLPPGTIMRGSPSRGPELWELRWQEMPS